MNTQNKKTFGTIRQLIFSFLALGITISVIGCGTAKKNQQTIQLMWWGDTYNKPFAERLARHYNKTKPSVPVEVYAPAQGQAYRDKIVTLAAGDMLPDILLVVKPDVNDLAHRNTIYEISSFLDRDDFRQIREQFWPGLMDDISLNGKYYGFPLWTWTVGIYYNSELFTRHGVTPPQEGWHWNDFLNMAKKMTITENKLKTFGTAILGGNQMHLQNIILRIMFKQNDLNYFSEDMSKCLINTPESKTIVDWACRLQKVHGVTMNASDLQNAGEGTPGGIFGTGRVGMVIGGRDQADVFTKTGISFNWDVAPLPIWQKEAYIRYNVYLVVSKKTKNLEGALDFIKYAIGEPGQRVITLSRSDVTVRRKLAYSDDFINFLNRPAVNTVFRSALEKAVPDFNTFRNEKEFYERAKNRFEEYLQGSKYTLDQVLFETVKDYQQFKD